MKRKKPQTLLKRKLHPLLSYAVLFGVGAIAVSSTGANVGANSETTAPVPAVSRAPAKPVASADLNELKAAAVEFASQLSVIKSQVAELEKYGRTPSPALMNAISEGDQLVAAIAQAKTLNDIGDFDAAAKLQSIGAAIAANSKF